MDIQRIAEELGALSRAGASPDGVAEAMAHVAPSAASLAPYLNFARGRYTRNLVYRDRNLELLVLCWDRGTRSAVHDHDGQECWFYVAAGEFCVEDYQSVEGIVARTAQTERLRHGAVDVRGPQNPIHRVSVTGSGPAVSVHVYSKPIDRCLVYDLARQRAIPRILTYDTVFGRPAAGSGGNHTLEASARLFP